MRLEGPQRTSPGGTECDCKHCRAPGSEKRKLLLSDDLPAFIRVCRLINHLDPDPTFVSIKTPTPPNDKHLADTSFVQIIIDVPRNGSFSYRRLCEKRKPSTTSIKFQNNTYGSTTPGFIEDTLTKLRKVAGDRQVDIVAPSHPWLAAQCKEAMMPKVVWGYAVGWDLVEVARELKAAADEVSRRDCRCRLSRNKR
jgi:hypothetical protein